MADFIKDWAQSLAARGLRTDQITLHMTRAEIGNYLGMTLETVSRALRRLAQCGVIRFDEKGRRDLSIPSLAALDGFIRSALEQGGRRSRVRTAARDGLRPRLQGADLRRRRGRGVFAGFRTRRSSSSNASPV